MAWTCGTQTVCGLLHACKALTCAMPQFPAGVVVQSLLDIANDYGRTGAKTCGSDVKMRKRGCAGLPLLAQSHESCGCLGLLGHPARLRCCHDGSALLAARAREAEAEKPRTIRKIEVLKGSPFIESIKLLSLKTSFTSPFSLYSLNLQPIMSCATCALPFALPALCSIACAVCHNMP